MMKKKRIAMNFINKIKLSDVIIIEIYIYMDSI